MPPDEGKGVLLESPTTLSAGLGATPFPAPAHPAETSPRAWESEEGDESEESEESGESESEESESEEGESAERECEWRSKRARERESACAKIKGTI